MAVRKNLRFPLSQFNYEAKRIKLRLLIGAKVFSLRCFPSTKPLSPERTRASQLSPTTSTTTATTVDILGLTAPSFFAVGAGAALVATVGNDTNFPSRCSSAEGERQTSEEEKERGFFLPSNFYNGTYYYTLQGGSLKCIHI